MAEKNDRIAALTRATLALITDRFKDVGDGELEVTCPADGETNYSICPQPNYASEPPSTSYFILIHGRIDHTNPRTDNIASLDLAKQVVATLIAAKIAITEDALNRLLEAGFSLRDDGPQLQRLVVDLPMANPDPADVPGSPVL